MIRFFTILLLFVISSSFINSNEGDLILGRWMLPNKKASVLFYKDQKGQYQGKVDWLRDDLKNAIDVKNANLGLRHRRVLGSVIIQDLVWDINEKQWINGTVYDPESGNTYNCYAWMDNKNGTQLNLKGYPLDLKYMGQVQKMLRIR